jgi:hypothetical protein
MVLGQRFKMLVLAPASLFMLLLGGIVGFARTGTLQDVVLSAAALIACLQCGYLLGLGIRHLSVVARAKRLRAAPTVHSVPARRAAH